MKNMILVGLMSIALFTGCAAIKSPVGEGYQFGDMTRSTLELQAKYCSEADPVQRALMLAAIKAAVPEFPASGVCTQLYTLLSEEQIAEIASDVDIEQTIEDQKKFQSK